MSAENSGLVPYTLTTVPEATHYPSGATWADPDVDVAAAELRAVFDDPAEARRRAELGATELARTHSLSATGARMAEALERLGAGTGSQRARLRDALRRVLPRRAAPTDARAEAIIEHLERARLDPAEVQEAGRALRTGAGDAAVVARALAHARRAPAVDQAPS
jgi:type II secretory pathway component HofQ